MAETTVSTRCRPLHTCGVSFLAILATIHTKTMEINGSMGSLARRAGKVCGFANPVIYAVLHHWLAILSFADDHILATERVIENHFPSSAYVFDKVDGAVQAVGTLPARFEDAMDRFPSVVHQVPFLERMVSHAIKWLNFLIMTLTVWDLGSTEEKDIMVDTNCTEGNGAISTNHESSPPLQGTQTDYNESTARVMDESPVLPDPHEDDAKEIESSMKCSYEKEEEEEVQEKGAQGNAEGKEPIQEETQVAVREGDEKAQDKSTNKNIYEKTVKGEDPILELFDIGWGSA